MFHTRLRPACLLAFVVAAVIARTPSLDAQLFPPADAQMTMGHVLLNVSDVAAHREFWTKQFDAKPVTVGKLEGVTVPGVVILFRLQPRTGPSEGTTINHMGLKVNKLADFTARFEKAGFKYDPPRIGRETTVQTYVTGPDTFRMELVEDPRIPAPVVSHHLHYWLEQPVEVKKFYVQKLLLKPTMRGPYESADLPGMNLTLAPLGSQKVPGVPMKGRLMDRIGFDVTNLKAYVDRIASNGVKFDVPYGRDAELGLMSAMLTDPWGATIQLTEGRPCPDNLRTIVYGGGPMYVDSLKKAMAAFGPIFVQLYGQGEAPMTITGLRRADHLDADDATLGSVGYARSGVDVAVLAADGNPAAVDEVGEIACRGDVVMSGYWNNPDATAATLQDGWLRTGDVGSFDTRGFLTLRDRSKDVVISGGSNIYPREVEEVLLTHPDVVEACVVGAPDEEWGEVVVAFIVGTAVEAELDAHLLERIARFKRPKRYLYIDELPKNSYGKVLKRELRERLSR